MKRISLLVLLCLSILPVFGQIKYCGKDFFVSVGADNKYTYENTYIQLASAHNAKVSFYFKSSGTVNTYTVLPYVPLIVTLTLGEVTDIVDNTSEVANNKSLEIKADSEITVLFLSGQDGKADDAMNIIPVDDQKKADRYLLLGMNSGESGFPVSYTYNVVSACDSVALKITPKVNTEFHLAGVPFTITLNKGDEFCIGTPSVYGTSALTNHDISGTVVEVTRDGGCCFPIAAFVTYIPVYVNWPTDVVGGVCCADLLLEQIMPENYWQKQFPVLPFVNDSLTVVRVMSASNGNQVYYDRNPVRVLNRGDFFDTLVIQNKPAIISANSPIGVAQFMVSQSVDTGMYGGDPDMLWNFSMEQGIRETVFKPYYRYACYTIYDRATEILALVSTATNAPNIRLNGNPLPTSVIHPFPADAALVYAQIYLNPDTTYHLISPDPVIAYHYEEERQGSYSLALSDLHSDLTDTGASVKSDTLHLCIDGTLTLTAGAADNYLWSNGATSQSVTISSPGNYTVVETIADGCVNRRVNHRFSVQQDDTLHQSFTVEVCAGTIAQLTGDTATSYRWSTGETTKVIQVSAAGNYSVTQTTIDSCKHIAVKVFDVSEKQFPSFDFAVDTTICEGDSIYLNTNYASAHWNTGATTGSIAIGSEGTYWAIVEDSCGRVHTDTIRVRTRACTERFCSITFPNAFTPNADQVNDLFRPVTYGVFTSYVLSVYNRWGELVFTTTDVHQGWDGLYKGDESELGVYYYYCNVTCPAKGKLHFKGDVTLVR